MHFSNLPLDIYITVSLSLDPLDILAFGQTCTAIREATHNRSVWIAALKHSAARSQICSATFDVHHMSIDQLKIASTAPLRLLRKLQQGSPIEGPSRDPHRVKPLTSFVIHHSHLSDNTWPENERHFARISFVPGGRFLIAFCMNELVIYDLLTYLPTGGPGIVLRIPSGHNFPFITSPDPTGNGFRLLTYHIGDPWGPDKITVFSINYTKEGGPPSVIPYSMTGQELKLFSNGPYTMVGNLVVFSYRTSLNEKYLSVWNFVENTVGRWSVSIAYPLDYEEVFTAGQHILLVAPSCVHAWLQPPLMPRTDEKFAPVVDVPLAFQHPLSPLGAFSRGSCAKLSDWYNMFGATSAIDFLGNDPYYHLFATYKFSEDQLSNTAIPVTKSRFVRSVSIPGGQLDTINVAPYALCHGHIVKPVMSSDGGQIFIVTSRPSSDPQDVISQLMLPKDYPPLVYPLSLRVDLGNFTFDPMSGRLAYLADEGKQIVLLDYLTCPSSENIPS